VISPAGDYDRGVTVALVLLLSVAFGAGDQYLGSLTGSGHAWAAGWSTDISLLSAPWLVLPFAAGATQREPRRAALLGLACTYMALLGYGLMTLSPVENAHLSVAAVRGFLVSERSVLVGGIVTGPLFGWFGQQWRTRRAIAGALVTAAALCLEPLARRATIDPIRDRSVWLAEVLAGVALAVIVLLRRRAPEPSGRTGSSA
jgi:Family of unknown function (DUF6518)